MLGNLYVPRAVFPDFCSWLRVQAARHLEGELCKSLAIRMPMLDRSNASSACRRCQKICMVVRLLSSKYAFYARVGMSLQHWTACVQ